MKVVTDEFEAVLSEYRFQAKDGRWVATFGKDLIIEVTVDEEAKTVTLTNQRFKLSEVIKHPRSKQFGIRFARKLKTVTNKIKRELARENREHRILLRSTGGSSIIVKPDTDNFHYGALRNYSPLCFCESCHRMVRENMMADDTYCVACKLEKKK